MNMEFQNESKFGQQSGLYLTQKIDRAVELIQKIRAQANYNSLDVNPMFFKQIGLLEDIFRCNLLISMGQVFDQLYDAMDSKIATELRSTAASQATTAIFTSSISQTQPRTIELPKTNEGLGFNVMSFEGSPVFISHITPDSVADKNKGLRKGDQLVSINGVNVEQADHKVAVELLKKALHRVILVVKYMPGLLNEIESSYIVKQQLCDYD